MQVARPNKRLELTVSRAIKSGWRETSSRFEATVKLTSQRTLILKRVSFRRSSAAAVRARRSKEASSDDSADTYFLSVYAL